MARKYDGDDRTGLAEPDSGASDAAPDKENKDGLDHPETDEADKDN